MSVEVVMPKFGLTMQEGTIQQWYKAEGDPIAAGEPLFEVETEKVLYDVEAPASGTIARILHPVETTVPVAALVLVIAEQGEDAVAVAARYAAVAPAGRAVASSPHPSPLPEREGAKKAEPGATGHSAPVTPAARKLARERGVDLTTVTGSGPGGRITREDVEAAIAAPPAAGTPMRGMRKAIAERMQRSLQTTAQLTITTEADVTPMVRRRRELQEQFPLTYTDLIVEAVAHALREHPRLNATVEGDAVRESSEVHVGLAVSLDEGLIVPVIHNADRKDLPVLAEEARTLAEKARRGSLSVDEVSGGTFTVTTLGAYGIDAFTPIIHLPQVAILGVGRVLEKPAVHDGKIAIRSLMTLSLTFDHRVVDGAPAAAFLQTVAKRISC